MRSSTDYKFWPLRWTTTFTNGIITWHATKDYQEMEGDFTCFQCGQVSEAIIGNVWITNAVDSTGAVRPNKCTNPLCKAWDLLKGE